MKRSSSIFAALVFVGTIAWFGPTKSATSQDQTDERLAALETQVANQTSDISSLWKHVRVLETADALAGPTDQATEPAPSTEDGINLSGTGKQSTESVELDGAYSVAAICDSGFIFSVDVVNVTSPDSFEFLNLFGEVPFDGSVVGTFAGDRYAFTINCDGNWTISFTPLS